MPSFSAWLITLFFKYVNRSKVVFSSIEKTKKQMAQLYLQPKSFHPPTKLPGVNITRIDNTDWPLYCFSSVQSKDTNKREAILYLHGGAFYREIVSAHWQMVAQLARDTGLDVIVPIYPMLPRPTATAVRVQEGLVTIMRQLDQKVVCIAGDSAGGNIALVLAQQLQLDHAELASLVRCVVLISPCLDLRASHPGIAEFDKRDPWLSPKVMDVVGPMWAGELDITDPIVSPLFGEVHDLPPTLLFVGTSDILCIDTRRLSAKYQGKETEDGIAGSYTSDKFTYVEREDMIHVWPLLPHREGAEGRELIVQFILKHTK